MEKTGIWSLDCDRVERAVFSRMFSWQEMRCVNVPTPGVSEGTGKSRNSKESEDEGESHSIWLGRNWTRKAERATDSSISIYGNVTANLVSSNPRVAVLQHAPLRNSKRTTRFLLYRNL